MEGLKDGKLWTGVAVGSLATLSLVGLYKLLTRRPGFEGRILGHVLEHLESPLSMLDPNRVIELIDSFPESGYTQFIGPSKGLILDKVIKDKNPKFAVELGGLYGYSTIRIARLMGPGSQLFSVEPDPTRAAIAQKLIQIAGLSNRVTVITSTAEKALDAYLPRILEGKTIDLLFIDHLKHLYVPDLQRAEKNGLLSDQAVVIADNILIPGAPEYKSYLLNNKSKYTSEFKKVQFRPDWTLFDEIAVSVYNKTADNKTAG